MGFFKSFLGIDQANDLKTGYRKATDNLNQGFAKQDKKFNQAYGVVDPFITSGRKANTAYDDMLGINGVDAQRNAYGMITSNPLYQNTLDQQNNAMLRYQNSRGNSGGALDLAAARVFQQNMGNWMDRYRDQGRQGLTAANLGADIRMQQGDNYAGAGATRANLDQGYYGAKAANRNTGVNNLMNLAGTVISGMSGMPMPKFGQTTQPGTAANGGWETQTTPTFSNYLSRLFT